MDGHTSVHATVEGAPSLVDRFDRGISYLRLSVTDRCDLRCQYCLPEHFKDFSEPAEWLSFTEIERVASAFSSLGVSRVRITGGEPLTRRGVSELAAGLSSIPGISDLSLSTNAVQLVKHAQALRAAGVARLNVSLDSLSEQVFKLITRGKLSRVLHGLDAAKAAEFDPVKINMVVMKGVNDHEVETMVDYCIKQNFTLRLIETMPIGSPGVSASSQYISLQTIRKRLAQRYELIPAVMSGGGPARYVQVVGTDLKIGFITPMSQHFCESCNRVRLSADGQLHLCLGQNDAIDLRTPIRDGVSDEELQTLIQQAVYQKPERHEFNEKPQQIVRFMASTGG